MEYAKSNDALGVTNRGNPAESGPVYLVPGRLYGDVRNVCVLHAGQKNAVSKRLRCYHGGQ